jgi:SAM-dependent methyltransferase
MIDGLKYYFVKKVYADHNDTRKVKQALSKLLRNLPEDAEGLNIGAGRTKIDSRIQNLELEQGEGIDLVGSVEDIPAKDSSFDFVITQEVLEHVESPLKGIKEIHRVLKPGGLAYIQLPFIIGFHPCPNDYWRFSHEGMRALADSSGLDVIELDMSVGPAVGFYRILVEFFAVLISFNVYSIYKSAKLSASLFFYPIKWLDPLLSKSPQARRIAGGYYMLCKKEI